MIKLAFFRENYVRRFSFLFVSLSSIFHGSFQGFGRVKTEIGFAFAPSTCTERRDVSQKKSFKSQIPKSVVSPCIRGYL